MKVELRTTGLYRDSYIHLLEANYTDTTGKASSYKTAIQEVVVLLILPTKRKYGHAVILGRVL